MAEGGRWEGGNQRFTAAFKQCSGEVACLKEWCPELKAEEASHAALARKLLRFAIEGCDVNVVCLEGGRRAWRHF